VQAPKADQVQDVRAFVRRCGKGEQSRSELRAFDEAAVVEAPRRREAYSQHMQVGGSV